MGQISLSDISNSNTEECIYLKDKMEIVCHLSRRVLMPLSTPSPLHSQYNFGVQDAQGRKMKGLTKATEGFCVSPLRIEGEGVWLLWSLPVSTPHLRRGHLMLGEENDLATE